jgi:hypothetical protein
VVIHQEVGNLGIQNRKGLSLVSFNGKLGADISEVLEKPFALMAIAKQYSLQLHNRAQTKWIF